MRLREDRMRRALTVAAGAIATILALAMPASAHEPVVLDSTDVLPWKAPIAVDGTDPIAFLGVLPHAGAVRSAQLRMAAGQPLIVGLGIPDLAPENALPDTDLPRVIIVAPDLTVTVVEPAFRAPFHNPEFNQDYLFLADHSATAIAGTYSLVVIGAAPARFFLATGVESENFSGIERGSVATDQQLSDWYTTAP